MFKSKSRRVQRLVRDAQRAIGALIDEATGDGGFRERETATLVIGNELERMHLEQALAEMASGYAEELRINHHHDKYGSQAENDIIYKRHQPGTATYHSLCGPLRVRRHTYRYKRIRNGPTVVPLELEAGLMHGMTQSFARSVALGYAKGPMRSYQEDMEAAFRRPPPRATLERKAKALGRAAKHANFFIEPVIRAEEQVPAGASVIVLGLDRTSVPMEEDAPGRKRCRRKKPRIRKKPKPIEVNWRMDYIGTVSFLDKAGEVLVTRKYRVQGEARPYEIVSPMLDDVTHALSQQPSLEVSVVQDGAMELWNNLRESLRAEESVTSWHEVLDWYHMDERLSRCLQLIESNADQRHQLRRQWHADLLRSDRAVDRILSRLNEQVRLISSEDAEELRQHLRYFTKRKSLMCYARMKRKRLPIGSGVTEGACKSLIAARAKRSGQRWRSAGLGAVLHLRAIHQSDRFDPFWLRFADRYRASRVSVA